MRTHILGQWRRALRGHEPVRPRHALRGRRAGDRLHSTSRGCPRRTSTASDACATPSLGAAGPRRRGRLRGGLPRRAARWPGVAAPTPTTRSTCRRPCSRAGSWPTSRTRATAGGSSYGIGYGERLVELLTEEMTKGGTVVIGDAVRRTKQRYFLETPRYDSYDEKSLMQWTLYGLPMYAVKTGLASGGASATSLAAKPTLARRRRAEPRRACPRPIGRGRWRSRARLRSPRPFPPSSPSSTSASTSRLPGSTRSGTPRAIRCPLTPGCTGPERVLLHPERPGRAVERRGRPAASSPTSSTTRGFAARASTGCCGRGARTTRRRGWKPVFGELSDATAGDGSNHGARPASHRHPAHRSARGARGRSRDLPPERPRAEQPGGAARARRSRPSRATPSTSIERRYRTIDLEAFYFNNTTTASRTATAGARPRAGPFGGALPPGDPGRRVNWAVPATDASGVWRILVVSNDNSVDGSGRGTWSPARSGRTTGPAPAAGSRVVAHLAHHLRDPGRGQPGQRHLARLRDGEPACLAGCPSAFRKRWTPRSLPRSRCLASPLPSEWRGRVSWSPARSSRGRRP